MRPLVKFYTDNFKSGFFTLLFLAIILYILHQFYSLASGVLDFFPASIWLKILILALFPCFLGVVLNIIFKSEKVKRLVEKLTLKAPKIAMVLKMLSPDDIHDKKFPEVKFYLSESDRSVRLYGFVTREWVEEGTVWCHVASPAYPLIFTGHPLEIKKEKLIYTGRSFNDLALTCLTFGMK